MSEIQQDLPVKQTPPELSETHKIGVHSAVIKSFDLVKKATELSADKKRAIIYSLYCFRCLFDDELIKAVPSILAEFNLVKGIAMPEKLDLYDLVFAIVNLKGISVELKALWYAVFPYVMALDSPHDSSIYAKLLKLLTAPAVLKAVLYSEHSIYIKDSVEELEALGEIPSHIIDWYSHYIDFKHSRDDNGKTNEEIRFLDWLKDGRCKEVYVGTEKLLDTLFDDDGILICNIAARVSLDGIENENDRLIHLKQTLSLIESALERGSYKKIYLHYYAAIIHIALKNSDGAKANLAACLELNPNFPPAKNMLPLVK